jgi:hypothetical protein
LGDAVDPKGAEAREIGDALVGPLRRLRDMAEMAEGDPLSPGVVEELAASATAFLTELDRVTFDLRRSVRVTWSEDVAPKLGKLSDATLRDKLNDWGTSIEMANLALLDRMRITLPTAAAILDKAALLEETF